MNESTLTFDEWFKIISSFENRDAMWEADQRVHDLPPNQAADYLERLFNESSTICKDLQPVPLSHMIWFFQGICSSYWWEVREPEVPIEKQVSTVLALKCFYTDFLDSYLLITPGDLHEAETAVYMMWDMDCLEGAAMFPESNSSEHLVDPIFEVLRAALRCKAHACQQSALHGLGHLAHYHPERVHAEIDWALAEKGRLHANLLSYAHDARKGMIQ